MVVIVEVLSSETYFLFFGYKLIRSSNLLQFVLASLGGWFLLGYGGYKLFGGKKEKKEEVILFT